MVQRHPVAIVLLTLCTFTVYAFFWLFETTEELKRVTRDESLSPATDVLLALCSCGLWGLYASYRNAKLTHRVLQERGVVRESRADLVAVLNLATLFVGWTWLVSMVLVQEELNALAVATSVSSPPNGDAPMPVVL